jgi:hypothetical protein
MILTFHYLAISFTLVHTSLSLFVELFSCPIYLPPNINRNLVLCSSPITNLSPYLVEWIEYYLMMGVEHFYLYDYHTTDDSFNLTRRYVEEGRLTWISWGMKHTVHTHFRLQSEQMNHCIRRFGMLSKWVLQVWVFIFPVSCFNLLHN